MEMVDEVVVVEERPIRAVDRHRGALRCDGADAARRRAGAGRWGVETDRKVLRRNPEDGARLGMAWVLRIVESVPHILRQGGMDATMHDRNDEPEAEEPTRKDQPECGDPVHCDRTEEGIPLAR